MSPKCTADRPASTDSTSRPDPLPLQVTVHNATALLSCLLLSALLAYVVHLLQRLRVYLPPLPRPLRILWWIFTAPRLGYLSPLTTSAIRFAFCSVAFYLASLRCAQLEARTTPPLEIQDGRATMTWRDGSTSTYVIHDMDAFTSILSASLSGVTGGKWSMTMQPTSSTVMSASSETIGA